MNANYIKPIPKRIEKRILNYDSQHNNHTGLRFYAYLKHDHKPSDDILHYVNKVWLPYANRHLKQIQNAA